MILSYEVQLYLMTTRDFSVLQSYYYKIQEHEN